MLTKNYNKVMSPYEEREARKAAGYKACYPYTRTPDNKYLFPYTQPRYMNGMVAPLFLGYFPAYFMNKTMVGELEIMALAYALASLVFAIFYLLVLRPAMLYDHLRLRYHKSYWRAVPLGFVLWSGVWLALLNIKAYTYIFDPYDPGFLLFMLYIIISFVLYGLAMKAVFFTGNKYVSEMFKKVVEKAKTQGFVWKRPAPTKPLTKYEFATVEEKTTPHIVHTEVSVENARKRAESNRKVESVPSQKKTETKSAPKANVSQNTSNTKVVETPRPSDNSSSTRGIVKKRMR